MLRGGILIVAAVLPLAEAFAPAARAPLRLAHARSAAASSKPLISMNDSGEGAGFSMPFFGKRQAGEKEVAAAEEATIAAAEALLADPPPALEEGEAERNAAPRYLPFLVKKTSLASQSIPHPTTSPLPNLGP